MDSTPTPWSVHKIKNTKGFSVLAAGVEEPIATVGKLEDAVFMVRACNSHVELLAACKKAMDECVDLIGTEAGNALEAAIANVTSHGA